MGRNDLAINEKMLTGETEVHTRVHARAHAHAHTAHAHAGTRTRACVHTTRDPLCAYGVQRSALRAR
eukprot:3628114-Rhodomonas_salina.1